MKQGWIRLHRKIQDWELYFSEPFTKTHAWIDLLIMANHETTTFFVRGIPITIERGQVARSEESLAKRWKWSRDKVRRFLEWLKTRQQIIQQKSFIINIVTIKNYLRYQETIQQTRQQTRQQNSEDTSIHAAFEAPKNVKECNKNKRILSSSDDDFLTPLSTLWNSTATKLPKVRSIPKSRKTKEAIRLREHPDLGWWKVVFEKVNHSDFLCGVNDRGWKADYDWIMKSDTHSVQIMEGRYENRNGAGKFKSGAAALLERDRENGNLL
jgi:hypothetical protein